MVLVPTENDHFDFWIALSQFSQKLYEKIENVTGFDEPMNLLVQLDGTKTIYIRFFSSKFQDV